MHKRIPMFLGMILIGLAAWLLITPNKFVSDILQRLDTLSYDFQLRTHVFTEQQKPNAAIAIVDIDEKSLKAEGRWPWHRSKLAMLIDQLHQQGAAVIAFDMVFPEKEPNIADRVMRTLGSNKVLTSSVTDVLNRYHALFDEDETFVKVVTTAQPVLAFGFDQRNQTTNDLPPPILTLTPQESEQLDIIQARGFIANIPPIQQATKYSGFINIFPDSYDGIIRRAPMLIQYKDGIYVSLSLRVVMAFLGDKIALFTPRYDTKEKLEGIQIGNELIPTDASGKVLIPFIGKSYTFPYYSATDVLHNEIPKDALLGKIVFVGTTALGLGDLQSTSIQSPYPGIEIHATLVNGILQNQFSSIPAWTHGAQLFITVIFGIISALLFPYLGPRMLALIVILFPVSILVINNWIWHKTGLVLSMLVPSIFILLLALLNIIYGYLFETRKREQLKEMFGQYVPEKHIDEMLKSSGSYGLRGESRELSVLFADIRNFTTISEGMPANELVDMLNAIFTPMTEIIFNHYGTIDKYVGDLIMAFWGAPLKDKQHAQHAIIAALEMQKKIRTLQPMIKQHHWPEVVIGIGINSGVMNIGDMGSLYRRNYTVLGDAVNLASRIEGLTKFYGVNILVTEHTHVNQNKFIFRKLDRVRVKGKNEAISIYEVVCLRAELTPELVQELATYHQALNDYFQQQWESAFTLMQQLQQSFPHCKIYSIYLERISEFKQSAPSVDWDGVYSHKLK